MVKGVINGQPGGGRLAVLAGMLLTAIPMGLLVPSSFAPLPAETFLVSVELKMMIDIMLEYSHAACSCPVL